MNGGEGKKRVDHWITYGLCIILFNRKGKCGWIMQTKQFILYNYCKGGEVDETKKTVLVNEYRTD